MAEWTTEDVREMARFTQSHLFSLGHGRGHGPDERAEVDRNFADWLTAHDAEVKAEALEEAATPLEGGLGVEGTPGTLYEYRAWLRARAAAIRGERS